MIVHPGNSAATGYNLQRSLRFRASASAYLSKTVTSGTNVEAQKWVFSFWLKRGQAVANVQYDIFNSGPTTASETAISIYNDQVQVQSILGSTWRVNSPFAPLLRDFSSWYHIVIMVDTTQVTASNRVIMYLNGVAYPITTQPAQNDYIPFVWWGNPWQCTLGRDSVQANNYGDFYLAEVIGISGTTVPISSFGSTNPTTGVWQPAKYTGTYGTNGFYLPFTDNSALTTSSNVGLGKDFSGNGNYWTTNNISITAGATYDSMTDVPTLTSATAANFAVLNPLDYATPTLTNGNLTLTSSGSWGSRRSTIGITSGKWYCEFTSGGSTANVMLGIISDSSFSGTTYIGAQSQGYGYFSDGTKYNNLSNVAYGASYTSGDVIGVAFDADARSLTFYKNNVSQGVAYTSIPTGTFYFASSVNTTGFVNANFGQRPFAYTPPSGYVALNAYNIPEGPVTTSGSFVGNVSADGPSINLNGVPTAMSINGNAVTFGTHADKTAYGFKLRTSSTSYNSTGTNTYSVTTTGAKFKFANAQGNP